VVAVQIVLQRFIVAIIGSGTTARSAASMSRVSTTPCRAGCVRRSQASGANGYHAHGASWHPERTREDAYASGIGLAAFVAPAEQHRATIGVCERRLPLG